MISTKEVPPRFLKSAMLVGCIPLTALRNDNRISYTLYIPPNYYNPDPNRRISNDSANLDSKYLLPPLPLIVNVHGTGRDVERCRDQLIDFANSERIAVLAPLFPAGLDGYMDLDNYKLLKSKTLRSDLALIQILDEVAAKWAGIQTQKFFLIGYSGGGQFVHRFAYLYPERLYALSIGAPGRVTLLDKSLEWPNGIENVGNIFGEDLIVENSKFEEIRGIQLVVGSEDNFIPGGNEFWTWVANQKELKRGVESGDAQPRKSEDVELSPPKKGRLDTLKALQQAWLADNIYSRLDIVPGVAHDALGVSAKVEEFLSPLVRRTGNIV